MEKNRFKEALLERKEFIYTLELVPGRGSRGKTHYFVLAWGTAWGPDALRVTAPGR